MSTPSTGKMSPYPKSRMSPTSKSKVLISCRVPFLTTVTCSISINIKAWLCVHKVRLSPHKIWRLQNCGISNINQSVLIQSKSFFKDKAHMGRSKSRYLWQKQDAACTYINFMRTCKIPQNPRSACWDLGIASPSGSHLQLWLPQLQLQQPRLLHPLSTHCLHCRVWGLRQARWYQIWSGWWLLHHLAHS